MATPVLPSLGAGTGTAQQHRTEPNISTFLWLNTPGYVTNIYIPAALLQAQDIPLQQPAHC